MKIDDIIKTYKAILASRKQFPDMSLNVAIHDDCLKTLEKELDFLIELSKTTKE